MSLCILGPRKRSVTSLMVARMLGWDKEWKWSKLWCRKLRGTYGQGQSVVMSHAIVLVSVKRGRSRNYKEGLLRSSDSVESSCAKARADK